MQLNTRHVKHYLDLNLKRFGLKTLGAYGRVRRKTTKIFPMNTTTEIKKFDLLIDGQLKAASDQAKFEAINPSKDVVFAHLADASSDDMKQAIACAKQCFDQGEWKKMTLAERGIYLKRVAKLIRSYAKELAALETQDVGKTSKQTTFIDIPSCADTFDYFGAITDQLQPRDNKIDAPVKSTTVFEPIGVVGCIIPWNYPILIAAWKIAPALMAGNSVILKPSPKASCSVMRLAQIFKEAQFPDGVIQVISTSRLETLKELVSHKDVSMISFTGGTATGKDIMKSAADSVKKLNLELGGKSPNIVLADCDVDTAARATVASIFMNQGQMCTAASRLLIEESIYEEFLGQVIERTKALKIGNATGFDIEFGPLVSKQDRDQCLKAIEKAVQQGAKLECGGKIPEGDEFKQGFYIEPTILSNVGAQCDIAYKEVFGPVLSVMTFTNIDQAIRQANDSDYGLAACIWTKDQDKANDIAARLECGTVWINTYGGFYNEASFGGFKQSGFGRELGVEGLLEFTQTKHICIDQTPGGKPLVASWF